jgi:predicted nucleic acid-binding Zn ribbon protein
MAKCAACGKELAADAQRFCDAECRGVFTKRLKHGTRSAALTKRIINAPRNHRFGGHDVDTQLEFKC